MAMSKALATRVVNALHGLAVTNHLNFCRDDKLLGIYRRNMAAKKGKHVYVADKLTCGWNDCWSTYKDMVKRYGATGPIMGDCEDWSCAHAGFLAATCHKGVYVGLVIGKKVSHAICGVNTVNPDADNSLTGLGIRIIDPSRWYGMPATHYNNPVWRKLV